MLRWMILLLCVAMFIVGSSIASWAHSGPPRTLAPLMAPAPSAAVPSDVSTQPLLVGPRAVTIDEMTLVVIGLGLAGALALGCRRGRSVLVLGISLLVVLVGFAAAVHSVHHLGDSQGANQCVLAASAEHVSGIDTDGLPPAAIAAVTVDRACANPSEWVRDASLTPARGRAPPA